MEGDAMNVFCRTTLAGLGFLLFAGAASAQFNLGDLKKQAADAAAKQAEKMLSGDKGNGNSDAPEVAAPPAPESPPTPEAAPAAVTQTSGAQDPFVTYCQKEQMAQKLYDCGCLGGEAASARAEWVSERTDPNGSNAGMITQVPPM